jgi:hypothetical protein
MLPMFPVAQADAAPRWTLKMYKLQVTGILPVTRIIIFEAVLLHGRRPVHQM